MATTIINSIKVKPFSEPLRWRRVLRNINWVRVCINLMNLHLTYMAVILFIVAIMTVR
jgi:hypothetical protein